MAEKRENRSSARSRRMIREAFLELLEEKEFDKITVTDIVNRADLNRSTFYHHYPDVHGVVEEIQHEIQDKSMEQIRQMNFQDILKDPLPYLISLCDVLEGTIRLFTQMGRISDAPVQIEKYLTIVSEEIMNNSQIPEHIRTAPAFEIRFHMMIGGIINTYLQWSAGKMHCTLADISLEFADLLRKFSADIIEADWLQ